MIHHETTDDRRAGPPRRSSHFAHRLVRLLIKVAAANELGPEACWLLTIIAHTEDARRYSGPVNFWNEQLAALCGCRSIDRLVRIRKKAVAAGWLVYTPGAKGRPAKYKTTIPPEFRDLPDDATDESGEMHSQNARESQGDSDFLSQNAIASAENAPRMRRESAENPQTSFPSPSPSPSSCPKLRFDETDLATAKWMFGKIRGLQPDRKVPNFDKWANVIRLMREIDGRTDDDIRDLFAKANQDDFWQVNVLCPDTLRKKWDDLDLRLRRCTDAKRNRSNVGPGQEHDPDADRPDNPVGTF